MEAMAVAAGGAALSVAFEAIFRKLSSPDVLKYASRNKVESEVNRWKKELRKMNFVLDDAEERQMSEGPIKDWLDELRDLAYDVEDILDEFSTQVMREKVTAEPEAPPSKVRKLISIFSSRVPPRDIKFNASLGSKMEKITQRFERLDKEKEDLNFVKSQGIPRISGGGVKGQLETTSLPEPHVYGREKDKKFLMNELLSNDSNGNPVSVVAIVGMGGLGKTTLAQLLYDDETVKGSFDIKAWVYVSDDFDVFKITVKIIGGFTKSPCTMKDLNNVQEELRGALHGKKFLLVLDDLWNEKYLEWDALIRPLGGGGLGSRVLITTRNEDVATIAGSTFMYHLKKLNLEECSSVLARHALGENDFSGHPLLKEIGEAIAKKCDGLPLAAKAIGGLLRSKRNHTGWSEILKSHMWELPLDQCPILPALRVSYHHLPPHLKRCFAYCAIFPKDYEFDKDELILWWKGEGFLEQSTDFMELGNEYFQDLLSRSFFQPSTYSKFLMHDLMNDLTMWISEGICLHLPHSKEIDSGLKFEKLRHLSSVIDDNEDEHRFEKFSSSMRLRTFIVFCKPFHFIMNKNAILGNMMNAILGNMMENMKYLKVLCLSRSDIEELPDSISELKLLRHLDMSFTEIRRLPESISDLLNLQILKLNGCRYLIELPREIRKLTNLQILDISKTHCLKNMPSGIDRLTNLQFLPKFIVGENHGLRLRELKGLSLLRRKLSISRLECVVDIQDAKDVDLKAKKDLVSLKFQWSADLTAREEEKHEQILDELWPQISLKRLKIEGYNGKQFPKRVGDSDFTNLEKLTVRDCNSVSSFLSFRGLSSLKKLNIRCSNLTNLPDELPLLGYLSIEGCSNLTNLPNKLLRLGVLTIIECSNLTNLPNELPLLGELTILGCSNLTNLPNEIPWLRVLRIEKCSNLTNLPNELSWLQVLIIKGCSNLTNFPNELPRLLTLRIEGCSNLTNLSNKLLLLRELWIEGCSNLTNLPNEFSLLGELTIRGCLNLTNLLNELPCLRVLRIEGCPNLTNLSNELPLLGELIIIGCSSLTNLPNELPSLEELTIIGCSNLTNLPNEIFWLQVLRIEGRSNLTNLPKEFHLLGELSIKGCSNLISLPNELPRLRELRIEGCSNLTNLPNELPLLGELIIIGCSNLKNLPIKLPSLGELTIIECSNLTNLSDEIPWLLILRIEGCSNLTNLPDTLPPLLGWRIEGCPNLTNLPKHLPLPPVGE